MGPKFRQVAVSPTASRQFSQGAGVGVVRVGGPRAESAFIPWKI